VTLVFRCSVEVGSVPANPLEALGAIWSAAVLILLARVVAGCDALLVDTVRARPQALLIQSAS
jgi:hypothetical protein